MTTADAVEAVRGLKRELAKAGNDRRELLHAKWETARFGRVKDGALWLSMAAEPLLYREGFIYLYDNTGHDAAFDGSTQAEYSVETKNAAAEFRRLAGELGCVLSRLPSFQSWLWPVVDGDSSGQEPVNAQWWFAFLFQHMALSHEQDDCDPDNGPIYRVTVEKVFHASETACDKLIEMLESKSKQRQKLTQRRSPKLEYQPCRHNYDLPKDESPDSDWLWNDWQETADGEQRIYKAVKAPNVTKGEVAGVLRALGERAKRSGSEIAPPNTTATLAPKGEADTSAVRNSMRRLSNGWRIDWHDETGHEGDEVDDLKGFDFIAQLIETPHVPVPTVRLFGIESDPIVLSDKHSVQPAWDSATESDVGKMEAKLKVKLRRLNKECQDAKDEGDDVAYSDSNAVRETINGELVELRRAKAGAIKPSGEARELNKPNANSHEAIRGAIRRAVKHLDDKQLKRLALHFNDFAKPDGTGTGYVYCPGPTVTWNVEEATTAPVLGSNDCDLSTLSRSVTHLAVLTYWSSRPLWGIFEKKPFLLRATSRFGRNED